MSKLTAALVIGVIALSVLQACAHSGQQPSLSLEDIQGGWWSSCDDPAVEFYIRGDQYSGDFEGRYTLQLKGNVLTFLDGLIDGHSVNVTHRPLAFQVVSVTDKDLFLRPMPGNPYVGDWELKSCE